MDILNKFGGPPKKEKQAKDPAQKDSAQNDILNKFAAKNEKPKKKANDVLAMFDKKPKKEQTKLSDIVSNESEHKD